jgi:hypothetical protein
MEIRGDGQSIERQYFIDGRAGPYDASARVWEASMLGELDDPPL